MKGLIAGLAALLVLGVGFFLYSSPTAPSAEMTEVEIAQIQAEVVQFAEAYLDMWNTEEGDGACERARAFIHPTRFVRIYNGEPNTDVNEYVRRCKNTVANWASYEAVLTDTEVRVFSPVAAMFIGTQSFTQTYLDGSPSRHYPVATDIYC